MTLINIFLSLLFMSLSIYYDNFFISLAYCVGQIYIVILAKIEDKNEHQKG